MNVARRKRGRLAWPVGLVLALLAMVSLTVAAPVHHAHVLYAELEAGTKAEADTAHRHAKSLHRHHDAASGAPAGSQRHHDDDSGMPRCPVCSIVTAAGLPLPTVTPAFSTVQGRDRKPVAAEEQVAPGGHHFHPVQPRAPPRMA